MSSLLRPLRGGCQCGRNSYIINIPENGNQIAQVLFDTDPRHRIFQATPLPAFIRVPLAWYHSSTLAYFPDETSTTIRRTYTHPTQASSKRGFCGFCGTPLSYWSEEPPSEADFIRLTLGSLCSEDLGDLEDMGLIPDSDQDGSSSVASPPHPSSPRPGAPVTSGAQQQHGEAQGSGSGSRTQAHNGSAIVARETRGVPWFDSMVAGSRLGRLRKSRGGGGSRDGSIKYEWEVVEWTQGDDGAVGEGDVSGQPSPSKRLKPDHGGSVEPMPLH